MTIGWQALCRDTEDPSAAGTFWAVALGWRITHDEPGEVTFSACFIAYTLNNPQKLVIAERRFRPEQGRLRRPRWGQRCDGIVLGAAAEERPGPGMGPP